MGVTAECMGDYDEHGNDVDTHHLCRLTYCDCGCHHAALDAHFDGAHRDEPDPFCQECAQIVGGEHPYAYDNLGDFTPRWCREPEET